MQFGEAMSARESVEGETAGVDRAAGCHRGYRPAVRRPPCQLSGAN